VFRGWSAAKTAGDDGAGVEANRDIDDLNEHRALPQSLEKRRRS